MMGLILKDLFCVKKTLFYVLGVMTVFGVIYSGGSAAFSVVGVMAAMMVISIVSTTISYDDFYHWDRYAAILPCSRRRIITAKYLLILILIGAAVVLSLILGAVFGMLGGGIEWAGLLASTASALTVAVLGAAVVIPLYYKFGVQQCRFVLIAVYGIPTLIAVLAYRLMPVKPSVENLERLLGIAAVAAPFLCVAALAASYVVAVRIYEKKELK